MIKANQERISKLLQEPAYHFPGDFYQDAETQLRSLFQTLADHQHDPIDPSRLAPFMLKRLYEPWIQGHTHILSKGGSCTFETPTGIQDMPLSITITNIHCTYGPYPVPDGYVAQDWGVMTLVIPKEEAEFKNYVHQKQLEKTAQTQGVYITIDTRVEMPLVFKVDCGNKNIVQDERTVFDFQFVSPHFGPWDEIYEWTEDKWKLRWNWRISDMDFMIEARMQKRTVKPTINWLAHRKEVSMLQANTRLSNALGLEDGTVSAPLISTQKEPVKAMPLNKKE